MHTIQTPRLHLRPIGAGDEALYCHLYTDPQVMRHIAAPLSAEAAQRAFRTATRLMQQPTPPLVLWVLTERDSSIDIGILALMRHATSADSAEVGTMLSAVGQGRGMAAEAQTALLDHLFSAPGLNTVWCRSAAGNGAAYGLMHSLGFVRTDAGAADEAVNRWEMTAERWRARRAIVLCMAQTSCCR